MVNRIPRTSSLIEIIFLVFVLTGVGNPCANLWGAPRVAVAWEFNGTNAEGWQPSHCLAPFVVSGGVLRTRITCDDPYMIGPPVSFPAAEFPYVVLRMRTDTTGTGEIFFSSSTRPGIVAGNEVGFPTRGDGHFHTYVVPMHSVASWGGTVDRLRLDPESVATEGAVEIDFIRVVSERFLGDWIFDAPGADLGWRPNPNLAPFRIQDGLLATDVIDGGASDPWMEGPEVELDADRFHVLQVRQRVTGSNQNYAAVYFTTADSPVPGEDKVVTVPIAPDGVWRTLRFNMAAHPKWQGMITSLRLDPVDTNARPTHIEIASIGFGPHWDFDLGDTMGWRADVAMSRLTVRESALRSVMEGDDPHMSVAANVRAEDFPFAVVRMRLDEIGPCDPRIYFATDTAPKSEQAAAHEPVLIVWPPCI